MYIEEVHIGLSTKTSKVVGTIEFEEDDLIYEGLGHKYFNGKLDLYRQNYYIGEWMVDLWGRDKAGTLIGESIFGGIVCFAMGCFGLFALPSGFDPVFAGFKAIWCLLAFGMWVYNFLIAAGKVKMGGYEISDDEPDDRRAAPRSDAEARLTELRSLYDRGLITEEEYEAKRRDILSDL